MPTLIPLTLVALSGVAVIGLIFYSK